VWNSEQDLVISSPRHLDPECETPLNQRGAKLTSTPRHSDLTLIMKMLLPHLSYELIRFPGPDSRRDPKYEHDL